jgi:hypothetical protein
MSARNQRSQELSIPISFLIFCTSLSEILRAVVGRGQYGVVCTATRISDKEVCSYDGTLISFFVPSYAGNEDVHFGF